MAWGRELCRQLVCPDAALLQVTVFLIGAYAKYNWPYVWVSADLGWTARAVLHSTAQAHKAPPLA